MKFKSPYFAAVDLGSNSFHMVIARVQRKRVEIIDREKEMIQLAKGISKRIEAEMQYPGHIKVVVIRETRAVEVAR